MKTIENSTGTLQPEALDGVITKRIMAFLFDASIISLFSIPMFIVIGLLGIITFGAAWLMFPAVWYITAIIYVMMTVSEKQPSTWGMRFFGIEMRNWQGLPVYSVLAAYHYTIFWVVSIVTAPLFLIVWLVPLFEKKKRCLHDLITGVQFVRKI